MRISRDRMASWQTHSADKPLSTLIPERDYSDLNNEDDQLRIWLPEPA